MAQNTKDGTDGIIELVDIVAQVDDKTPAAKKIDFDSQLSDLLGKGKAITLDNSPELEELLSDLDGDPSTEKPSDIFSRPQQVASPDSSPDDSVDALFTSAPLDAEKRASSSPTPVGRPTNPMDDVDKFIDHLDVPPSETRSKTAPTDEPKPEVEDLDSLLDSLFSSPAAEQINKGDPKPVSTPPAMSNDTPLVNADELDALFNPKDEEPTAPEKAQTAEGNRPTSSSLPDSLDKMLLDITPAEEPQEAAEADTQAETLSKIQPDSAALITFPDEAELSAPPQQADAQTAELDTLMPQPEHSEQDSADALRQKDAADIAAILDEAMPVFEASPFRVPEATEVAVSPDTAEALPELTTAPPAIADISDAVQNASFPELANALDERLARLESGLHSLNERIANLEEQIAASSLTTALPASFPDMTNMADITDDLASPLSDLDATAGLSALSLAEERVPAQNLEDLLTEGNALCEQLKALVRTLIAAELPAPVAEIERPDPNTGTIAVLAERLATLEVQLAAKAEETSHADDTALNALEERLLTLEAQYNTKAEAPDPADAIAALAVRLDALETHCAAPLPELPDSASIAEDVLALVRVDMEKTATEAAPQTEAANHALTDLQQRLRALEERPLPTLPDSTAIKADVLEQVRTDLDKLAAESAARVLREEIAALLGNNQGAAL
ncbi:MAG: hypothetical protein RRY20_00630 [Bilophila sp.]